MGRCVGRARHHAAGGEDGAERMRATMVQCAGGPYAAGPAGRALCGAPGPAKLRKPGPPPLTRLFRSEKKHGDNATGRHGDRHVTQQ
jgi:hypothetical protein